MAGSGALPVLAVLVTLLYWLWRVRIRTSLRGLVAVRVPIVAETGKSVSIESV
jgi:hypothetical protein